MGINGGTGIVGSGAALGGSGIHINRGGGQEPFSFGNALQFDGTDDFVNFNEILLSEGSISIWYKTPQSGGVSLLSGDGSNTANQFELWTRANRAYIRFYRENVFSEFKTLSQPLNNWHHIFLKITPTNASLWFDGLASIDNPISSSGDVAIKRMGTFFSGNNSEIILDEVAIWDTPFDLPASLYSGGNGDYATNYSPANLVAYWRFNENDGATTLVDEQGSYNGELNNFITPPAYFIPH